MSDGHADTQKTGNQYVMKYGNATFSDIYYHQILGILNLDNKTKSHLVMNIPWPSDIIFSGSYKKDRAISSTNLKNIM